jgi:hypothetical protein
MPPAKSGTSDHENTVDRDAPLSELNSDATDFLDRPANQECPGRLEIPPILAQRNLKVLNLLIFNGSVFILA